MNEFLLYAPLLLIVFVFFLQYKIFVTPEQLEKKHKKIIEEIENRFAQKEVVNILYSDFHDVKEKIDRIYELLINNNYHEQI